MNTIRILHLGDVHYDEAKQISSMDLKDPNVPVSVLEAATIKPLQAVVRAVTKISLDGIAITGDLTTNGDLSVYKDCVKFLTDALSLSGWQDGTVHAVAGNHDVDSALIGQDDPLAKFAPLEEAWDERGVSALRAGTPSIGTITGAAGSVRMLGLNSSVSTAELQSASVPKAVSEALQDAKSAITSDKDLYGLNAELFDTPSFVEDHIAETCDAISELEPETVPILVAHHNLMPQALTRVAPYTHVLNGGMARTRLAGCERPVLYLHGHTHESRIEVVREYAPGRGELVCISAPLMFQGYNLLELSFTNEGLPLGCLVRQFRVTTTHGVEEAEKVPVGLVSDASEAGPMVKEIVRRLAEKSPYRLGDMKGDLEADLGRALETEALADAVSEAEWQGLAEVKRTRKDPISWRIYGELP